MSNKIIKINRGDSFKFIVNIPDQEDITKNYLMHTDVLEDGTELSDAVYFTLTYPNTQLRDFILCRGYVASDQLEDGSLEIHLLPEDTANLPVGIYYYTVKLKTGGSINKITGEYINPTNVYTIIERTKFIINE